MGSEEWPFQGQESAASLLPYSQGWLGPWKENLFRFFVCPPPPFQFPYKKLLMISACLSPDFGGKSRRGGWHSLNLLH